MADSQDITWAVEEIKRRSDLILLYRDYYDGRHRSVIATPKWNKAFGEMFKLFRDNLCPRVVDAKADRIQISSITAGANASTLNATIDSIWTREEMSKRQGEIHKNSLKDGDAFVIVWPDEDGRARWFVQRGDRVAVEYASEPQGEIEKAAKLWPVDEYTTDENSKCKWRLNLYYADRTERYVTQDDVPGGDVPKKPEKWDEFVPDRAMPDEGDDEGPFESRSIVPNDYGIVPVFPFPNNADLGSYGRSELRDVIPIQDALNKSVLNLIVAGEFVSYPQRYIIGLEVDTDEQGNPTGKEQKAAFDRILTIGNPNAKAGTFEGANLEGFIKEQDNYRAEMARISGTPLHYLLLSGEFPSGAALETAEHPLMSQVVDRQINLGPAWLRATAFSLVVEGVSFEPTELVVNWKDTAYHDPAARIAEWTAKKDLGIPDEQIWREMGYDEDKIEEFTKAKEERAVAMQAAFNAGTPDVVNPEAQRPGVPPPVS